MVCEPKFEALVSRRAGVRMDYLERTILERNTQNENLTRMLRALRADIIATISDPPKETPLVIAELRIALKNSDNLQKLLGVEIGE
jgi:hypothetical protein